jgi:RHS repeat-associated protein
VIGEYGTSATNVIAERIWMTPEIADGGAFGGDDGTGGYAPIALVAGTTLRYVHGNHLGVPALYTSTTGAAVATPAYTLPGFPGQFRTNAELYYNKYRDYDISTGRYIQADPIGLAGDVNPYLYALGNPVRYTDPTGEVVPLVVLGGVLLGAGMDLAIQAGANVWNGKDIWDADCYDWKQVAISGGLGGLTGGFGAWLSRGAGAADDVAEVLLNQQRGNAARDELADLLTAAGRDVNKDKYFPTPFGKRYVDIDVWHNGLQMGGIEVKTGGSRYLPHQRAKDFWLWVSRGYKVQLVRLP